MADMTWIQLIIGTILIFVLLFGIAFILNMLLKTTWLPIWAYVIFLIVYVYVEWKQGSFWHYLGEYTFVDIVPGIGGLIGAFLGGKTIKLLRDKGYKMF